MQSATLSGEVQECIDGVWRTVLTPGGTPVQDHRATWRFNGEDISDYVVAVDFGYPDIPVYTVERDYAGRITWKH